MTKPRLQISADGEHHALFGVSRKIKADYFVDSAVEAASAVVEAAAASEVVLEAVEAAASEAVLEAVEAAAAVEEAVDLEEPHPVRARAETAIIAASVTAIFFFIINLLLCMFT